MAYNFNPQFPFPWSSSNPYVGPGYGGGNGTLMPVAPSFNMNQMGTSVPTPPVPHPAAVPTPQNGGLPPTNLSVFNPMMRFNGAMYPYMNSGYQGNGNPNWNYGYPVHHQENPQAPCENQQSAMISTVPNVPVKSASVPQSVDQESKSEKKNEVSEDLVVKVTSILSNPEIMKCALETFKNSSPSSKKDEHLSGLSPMDPDPLLPSVQHCDTEYDSSDLETDIDNRTSPPANG